MSEKMGEMLMLMQRAEKMEYANEEIAFNLYLELFEKYEPQVSKPYESAIRLLEKRERLQEALDIANRAIVLIQKNQMTAGVERFNELAERIEKKMREQGIKPVKHSNHSNLKSILIIIGVVLAMFVVTLFATPYGKIFINFDQKEGLNSDDGGILNRSDEYKNYPITQKMIDYAVNNSERNNEVVQTTIVVDRRTIGLGIVTKSKNEKKGREIVKETLTYLAAAAKAEYQDLAPPSEENLGGIYLHYDLVISVGTGVSEKTFYLHGTMNGGGKRIYYKEDADENNKRKNDSLSPVQENP